MFDVRGKTFAQDFCAALQLVAPLDFSSAHRIVRKQERNRSNPHEQRNDKSNTQKSHTLHRDDYRLPMPGPHDDTGRHELDARMPHTATSSIRCKHARTPALPRASWLHKKIQRTLDGEGQLCRPVARSSSYDPGSVSET